MVKKLGIDARRKLVRDLKEKHRKTKHELAEAYRVMQKAGIRPSKTKTRTTRKFDGKVYVYHSTIDTSQYRRKGGWNRHIHYLGDRGYSVRTVTSGKNGKLIHIWIRA